MRLDTGFRPSKHGLAFSNRWRDMLFGVLNSPGRCGGMVFAALDAFAADQPLPSGAREPSLPAHDSPLAARIWRRQVDSVVMRLAANLWQFVRFTWLPSASTFGIAAATRRELLPLFDMLRAGRPAPLGLVNALRPLRLAANHQVLAYAADFGSDEVAIRIYDPNHPMRDDVVLVVPLSPQKPITEHVDKRTTLWRGFFIEHYSPSCAR